MISKLINLLKKGIAHVGNFIRKLWNFPFHVYIYFREAWIYWYRQVIPIWKYSEVAEYFEALSLSIQLFLASLVEGWKGLKREIYIINRNRMSLVLSGSSSWIDKVLYS